MLKYSLLFLFLIFCTRVSAGETDTLFAVRNGSSWAVKYMVKTGETKQMLANRFYLSEAVIEQANGIDPAKKLIPGNVISLPVITKNYFNVKPAPIELVNFRELYYHVIPNDDIETLSMYAGVTRSDMRKWNNLKGNTLTAGQVLFIGWLKVEPKDSTNPRNELAYYYAKKKTTADTSKTIVLGGLDTVFNRQTNNGINVLNEKGTAVFFNKAGKNDIYSAFHNSTPKGSIIKVFNPGTGKTIYVKVLGPLPNTKFYANSIIGICLSAKEALGVTETKAWCELTYSTN
jgi:LysM repeat protein